MIFTRHLASAALILACCGAASAQTRPGLAALTYDQEDVVTAWIWAQHLEASCPTWRLNTGLRDYAFVQLDLRAADFSAGGKFGRRYAQYKKNAAAQLSQVKPGKLCDIPSEFYGPSGSWAKNWMVERR